MEGQQSQLKQPSCWLWIDQAQFSVLFHYELKLYCPWISIVKYYGLMLIFPCRSQILFCLLKLLDDLLCMWDPECQKRFLLGFKSSQHTSEIHFNRDHSLAGGGFCLLLFCFVCQRWGKRKALAVNTEILSMSVSDVLLLFLPTISYLIVLYRLPTPQSKNHLKGRSCEQLSRERGHNNSASEVFLVLWFLMTCVFQYSLFHSMEAEAACMQMALASYCDHSTLLSLESLLFQHLLCCLADLSCGCSKE